MHGDADIIQNDRLGLGVAHPIAFTPAGRRRELAPGMWVLAAVAAEALAIENLGR